MAITIANRAISRPALAGKIIKDGTAATVQGVLRSAAQCNALLAWQCKQVVSDWVQNPFATAVATTFPLGRANGARWKMQITPPWTSVQSYVACRTAPGAADSIIYLYSRTDVKQVTFNNVAFAWLLFGAGDLAVSSVGYEEFYIEFDPGIGETVYYKGLTISEISRVTL